MSDQPRAVRWILVILILALAAGGILSMRLLQPGSARDKLAIVGDQAAAEQKWAVAAEMYAQAASDAADRVPLHIKEADALSRITVGDATAAAQNIQRRRTLYARILEAQPDSPEVFNDWMQLLVALASDAGDSAAWQAISEQAAKVASSAPSPQMRTLARKYRGMASTMKLRSGAAATRVERQQAGEDLAAAHEADPADHEAAYYLQLWRLHEGRAAGDDTEKAAHFAEAARLRDTVLAASPGAADLQRQVHVSLELGDAGRADELAQQAEAMLTTQPDAAVMLRLAQLAPTAAVAAAAREGRPTDGALTDARKRALALLAHAAEAFPGNIVVKWTYATALKQAGRTPDAIETYAKLRTAPLDAEPVFMLREQQQRQAAGIAATELRLAQASEIDAPAAREAATRKAEAAVEEVEGTVPEAVRHLLRGKLAVVRREWAEAAMHFDRACDASGNRSADALQLSGQTHARAGNYEKAVQRYEQILALAPDATQPRLELARLHLKQNELIKARRQLDQVLAASPQNVAANALMATLLTETGQVDQAIALYKKLDPQANPQLIPALAGLYRQAGRPQEARSLLEARFAAAPDDLTVLQQLVTTSTSREQALAYVQQAKQAGVPAQTVGNLEKALSGQSAPADLAADAGQADSPFDQALARFRSHAQRGEHDAAQAALAEAAAIKPQHAVVVDGQFQYALRNKDWQAAAAAADSAGTLNLDFASGDFYRGRSLLAQQKYQEAQDVLRRALNKRDNYASGWVWLGESQRLAGQNSQAIASYQKALQLSPDDTSALTALGASQHADGRHQQALETFRKLAGLAPDDRRIVEQYLVYEQTHGQPQQVLAARQRRANVNPKDFDNRRNLALLQAKMQQPEQAKQTMADLMNDQGRTRSNLLIAAEVHRLAGDAEGTRALLQENIDQLGEKATADDWLMLARYLRAIAGSNRQGLRAALGAYRQAQQREDQTRPASRELADVLFMLRADEEAATLYGSLAQDNLLAPEAALRYAEVLSRLDRLDEATSVLASLPESAGASADAHNLRGLVALKQEQHEEAITHFDRALAQQPNNMAAHLHRARAIYALPGREADARKAVTRALEIDSGNVVARQISAELYRKEGDLQRAIRDYERIADALPDNKGVLLSLAELYGRVNDQQARRAILQRGAEQFPDDASFHAHLAELQLKSGEDRATAIKHLEQLVKASPHAQNIATLAIQLLLAERPQDAIDMLAEHDQVVQQTPELLALRGRALAALDRDAEAADAFAQALARCETYPPFATVTEQMTAALGRDLTHDRLDKLAQENGARAAWANLTVAQLRIESGKVSEGLDLLRMIDPEIASNTPARTTLNRLLAFAYNSLGEYDKARIALESILANDAGNPWATNFLGRLLVERLNQPGKAAEVAEQGLARDPKDWRLLDLKGWALVKLGQHDAAIAALRQGLAIKQTAAGSLHMAQAYAGKRDVPNAKLMFNQAIQLAGYENNAEIAAEAQRGLQRLR